MSATLFQFMATESPKVRTAIETWFGKKIHAAHGQNLYHAHFAESLENLQEIVLRDGKMIRPLLVLLAYRLAGGKSRAIYDVAAAIELIHKQLLCLDDMADRDELRNGGPSLWREYEQAFAAAGWTEPLHHGRTFAEIDSTLLGVLAWELLNEVKLPAAVKTRITDLVAQLSYQATLTGWQIHYYQNHQPLHSASEDEYLEGLQLVSARYTFEAPLLIGLTAAGQTPATFGKRWTALVDFAAHVGRAFQLQDDVLGLLGDPKVMGKPVGHDVREGKKTLLLQYAYRTAAPKDQKFLERVCGADLSPAQLERVQKIVRATGALEKVTTLAKSEQASGIAALDVFDGKTKEVQILKELAQFVVERKK